MQPNQVPMILWILNQVWFSMALLLLLVFTFRITGLTAAAYGALPAALVFGGLGIVVVAAVVLATQRPTSPNRF